MREHGDLRTGGAAGYWSPERRVRRRQAVADDGLWGNYDLEGEGKDGGVHSDGELTLVAWMLASVKEEVGDGSNGLDGASPSAGKKRMARSICGVPRRFRR